ncbi:ABC transporter ATP-binding protein [Hippea alviniae]|uniref:ABC transporter ATP-binding protein n=1 Tax=Hippea alviniae TaxID=1279027 RepID=UPI0003B3F8B2|nr:ABC transporter ATP-binding protein [Hippea alviniae]
MLRVEHVSFSYNSKLILNDIDFEVEKGEFFAIAGPNGAGKSTLIKIIGRLLKPNKGNLYLNGKNFRFYRPKELARKISVVSQNPSYAFVRVEEFVLLGRIPYFSAFQFFEKREDREAIEEALLMCNVEHLKKRYMNELSGGERQLVFLAKAISTKPELLVMDEPLSGLDISRQDVILSLLEKMRREFSLTIIAVLHDLNVASEFADRILLMKDGSIFKMGKPSAIIKESIVKELYNASEKVKVFNNPFSGNPFVCITR